MITAIFLGVTGVSLSLPLYPRLFLRALESSLEVEQYFCASVYATLGHVKYAPRAEINNNT